MSLGWHVSLSWIIVNWPLRCLRIFDYCCKTRPKINSKIQWSFSLSQVKLLLMGYHLNSLVNIEFEFWRSCRDIIPLSKMFCTVLISLTSSVENRAASWTENWRRNKMSDTPNRFGLPAAREERLRNWGQHFSF